MPRQQVEVLTTSLGDLPVVRAWTGLGYAAPGKVEILRRKSKSVIYRLAGVGRGESDVIAKSCWQHNAAVERRIYADVLPRLPIDVLAYYGFAEGEGGAAASGAVTSDAVGAPVPAAPGTSVPAAAGGSVPAGTGGSVPAAASGSAPAATGAGAPATHRFSWLFLEDAVGEEFEPSNPEHREALTHWLARMHTASSALAAAAELPHRGTGHYLEHLYGARRIIRHNYGNPGLSLADREVIDQILDRLDFIEARWEDLEAGCREIPWSLVHGDIAERNVRIRRDAAGLSVFVFDWEVAGWGLSPVDLAHADVELYASLVRDTWPTLDLETLQRHVNLCKLMRGGLAATHWSAESLTTPWVEKPIRHFIIYYARMTQNLRALGWLH